MNYLRLLHTRLLRNSVLRKWHDNVDRFSIRLNVFTKTFVSTFLSFTISQYTCRFFDALKKLVLSSVMRIWELSQRFSQFIPYIFSVMQRNAVNEVWIYDENMVIFKEIYFHCLHITKIFYEETHYRAQIQLII